MLKNFLKIIFICSLTVFLLTDCTPSPPQHELNACEIFNQYPHWYWEAQRTQKKWDVPVSTQLAFMYQESHFNATAKPPREHILWIIPWKRPTSAYGYSQAVDSTWELYKQETGHWHADRDSFSDASDFIGWYLHLIHIRTDIPMNDVYALYLAYHEGSDNYLNRSYRYKPELRAIASKVSYDAARYHAQLIRCQASLPVKHWWNWT